MSPHHPSIAELNDVLRSSFLTGTVMLTQGILGLPEHIRHRITREVRLFDDFHPDNDPHGEHDFGSINEPGAGTVFWKIDYYDRDLSFASPDPADPTVTERVLTTMLAEEY